MLSSHVRQEGVSLIEILVTLAIVAIVMSFALPTMKDVFDHSELRATSNKLMYALETARSEAIKRTSTVTVCPSKNSQAATPACGGDYQDGWIVYVDRDQNGAFNTSEHIVLQAEPLSTAFVVSPDAVLKERVSFGLSGASTNPVGMPISGDIVIRYKGFGEHRTIRVAASGRITATSSSGSTTKPHDAAGGAGS